MYIAVAKPFGSKRHLSNSSPLNNQGFLLLRDKHQKRFKCPRAVVENSKV